jgi:hypothetical protein
MVESNTKKRFFMAINDFFLVKILRLRSAGVAELADAPDSKSGSR